MITERLFYYGLGTGIPYAALNSVAGAVDLARNARDVSRRRQVARSMLKDSPWAGFIPKDRGFATTVIPRTLPGTAEVIDAALRVIEDRRTTGWKARTNNPFYQCERPEDFVNYPALMNFALSDAMLHIVSDYYGMVPQLKEIGIWLTPAQEGERSSQLYHLDKPEVQIVGLFMNLEPQGEESGPAHAAAGGYFADGAPKNRLRIDLFPRRWPPFRRSRLRPLQNRRHGHVGWRRGLRRLCRHFELLPFRQPLPVRRAKNACDQVYAAISGARVSHPAIRPRSRAYR